MSKLGLIIAREYVTRVRKKVFIIMSILGPLLFAGLMIVPVWIAQLEDQEEKTIAVIEIDEFGQPVPDSLMLLKNVFESKPLLTFRYPGNINSGQATALVEAGEYYGVLVIRHKALLAGDQSRVELICARQPSLGIEAHIEKELETFLYGIKLRKYKVPLAVIQNLKTDVSISIRRIDEENAKTKGDIDVKRALGYVCGFLIYMFIFFFGSQVMRGVVEEKTNRIMEVIITSVRPFQLMMGKIIGIGLVGLTQFLTWMILSFFIFQFAQSYFINEKLKTLQEEQMQQPANLFDKTASVQVQSTISADDIELTGILKNIQDIDFKLVLFAFVFYFIFGYLLYAAMFAAIGAAVDSETDTQQFMLPVTIPLIVGIFVMMNAISNPEGQVAMWFSMIPFTSPIVMMARIGFKFEWYELAGSMALLVLTFVLITWLAAKIYRTGILMYGKKTGYKELMKWIRYK